MSTTTRIRHRSARRGPPRTSRRRRPRSVATSRDRRLRGPDLHAVAASARRRTRAGGWRPPRREANSTIARERTGRRTRAGRGRTMGRTAGRALMVRVSIRRYYRRSDSRLPAMHASVDGVRFDYPTAAGGPAFGSGCRTGLEAWRSMAITGPAVAEDHLLKLAAGILEPRSARPSSTDIASIGWRRRSDDDSGRADRRGLGLPADVDVLGNACSTRSMAAVPGPATAEELMDRLGETRDVPSMTQPGSGNARRLRQHAVRPRPRGRADRESIRRTSG